MGVPAAVDDGAGLLAYLRETPAPGMPTVVLQAGVGQRTRLALQVARAASRSVVYVSGVPRGPGELRNSASRTQGRIVTLHGPLERAELQLRLSYVSTGRAELIALDPGRCWQARVARTLHNCRPEVVIIETSALAAGAAERRVLCSAMIWRLREVLPAARLVLLSHPMPLEPNGRASLGTEREIDLGYGYSAPIVRHGGPLVPPSIALAVRTISDDQARVHMLAEALRKSTSAAVIIAPTRGAVVALTLALQELNVDAAGYHSGLAASERSALLVAFREGRQRVLVATEAIHLVPRLPFCGFLAFSHLPRSLESVLLLAELALSDPAGSVPLLLLHDGSPAPELLHTVPGVPSITSLERAYRSLQQRSTSGHVFVEIEPSKGFQRGRSGMEVGLAVLCMTGYLQRRSDFARAVTITQLAEESSSLAPLDTAVPLRRGIPVPVDPLQVATRLTWPPQRLHAQLLDFDEQGLAAVETFGREALYSVLSPRANVREHLAAIEKQMLMEAGRAVHTVVHWLAAPECRVQALARELQWDLPEPCARCDRCNPGPAAMPVTLQGPHTALRALAVVPSGVPRGVAVHLLQGIYGVSPGGGPAEELIEELLQARLLETLHGELGQLLRVTAAGREALRGTGTGQMSAPLYTDMQ